MAASKRAILDQLTRNELQALVEEYGLDAIDRRVREHLVEACASSRKLALSDVLATYSRHRLKAICRGLQLDDTGKEKRVLLDRLLTPKSALGYDTTSAASAGSSGMKELGTAYGRRLQIDGLLPPSRKAPAKPKRRTGGLDLDSAASGSLKSALQQFALGAAGGYRGREGPLSFTTHLLECFGWKDGRPEGAELLRRFSIAEGGQHIEREVALWWAERRVLMEVVPHDAVLGFAWKDFVRVVLQLDVRPQYVVFTNQRDLQLYDLARDRETPRLSIPIDDLPRYSEAFPFFRTDWVHGMTPRIVNVEKVSAEVADLVAKLFRSVRAQHAGRDRDVTRFVLQCITAMFAEDIGLLPRRYFTSLLYEGAKARDVDKRLRELFVQMNTRDLPEPRAVPYFNGGLFTDAVTLPLGNEQLIALTKAAEADWTYVDPHIFGSVFQGIMDDAERHASGAHYTAQDDIMRVVGPTIVEPWRRRIQAAKSLTELTELRAELFKYRVLDPACGSGNFLYVAFREIYRLDTELLSRMREFPSTHAKLSWNGGIQPRNFFGIDINPFAVELAKVTLNIAKKIAFEERKAQAFALSGQVEIDLDPSLPLDNLDENVVCRDALFTKWPEADAIIGNPPFLGGSKIRRDLGPDYVRKLQGETGADEVVDLACYWFRRAHDRLREGARAGFIATSGIRIGKAREAALDYIAANHGTITNAVSSRPWPGESAVNVSVVNWIRGAANGPFYLTVDEQVVAVSRIPTHLQLHADISQAVDIARNRSGATVGVMFGHDAFRAASPETFGVSNGGGNDFIRPVATGDDLLRGRMATSPEYCVYLANVASEDEAKRVGGPAFEYLKSHLYPWLRERAESGKETNHYGTWFRKWWKPRESREDFFGSITEQTRLLVCPKVASRPSFAFLSTRFVPNDTLKLFAFDDDYTFGVIQSGVHWEWTKARGGKVRADIRYTSEVWRSFPWPQDPTDEQVAAVAAAARGLRRTRAELMEQNGWSLRTLHQAAEVNGLHPLKDAQAALDAAVREAYGVPSDQDPVTFLLELNQLVAEDESQGRQVRGPGLPDHLDGADPRFTSTDCIEPPKDN